MPIQYSEDHTWLQIEGDGDTAVMGITLHAQDTLGDIVFVDLPAIGKTFAAKEVAGVVESVKAAADVHMPAGGEIIEVNEALRADPSLANSDPLGQGWFFKVKLTQRADLDALHDEASYQKLTA
ncbi:glycine cleavage system protein GcvH [Limnohabitans sp.]|jgi:glycine cleavage system H protein|uniref:glycine cleavage system protein GcvH n=1 Tax=Limnohabitans sp. TaxID=1907725 RepID=UPI001B4042F9|nr:glycine cleavage system protein GcvH [Limnohabitans sp.]MBP6221734.1 glycine cleavage system protein GcvH [Limnohabitans sp.]MBP6245882.1 glycine cleavage system protein GcvH [Limnohabitans sp.]